MLEEVSAQTIVSYLDSKPHQDAYFAGRARVSLGLSRDRLSVILFEMRLRLENLPRSLHAHGSSLAQCLEAMHRAMPLSAVYLFGSHARGEARPDSDVDLCLVAAGAVRQLEASARFREAIWDIWPRPALTLVPLTPQRLAEKRACGDHFFQTVLKEGVLLAAED